MSVSVFLSQSSGPQIASFLRTIKLSSMACPALPYFSKFAQKGMTFGNKFME
jgi:hypothetical protein